MQRGDGWKARLASRVDLVMAAVFLVGGWLFILVVNRWHVAAPVVFLWLGWLAVVLCAQFFFRSARAAAGEGTGPEEEGFELSAGRVAELEKEKRALLKAIKEVEFDREMGKMSDDDAEEIARVYRARAIDVLKELDGVGESSEEAPVPAASLSDVIDREIRARLILAGVGAKVRKAKPAAKAGPAGKAETTEAETAKAEPAAKAEPDAAEAADGEPDSEPAAEPASDTPASASAPGSTNGKNAGRPAGLEKREDA